MVLELEVVGLVVNALELVVVPDGVGRVVIELLTVV